MEADSRQLNNTWLTTDYKEYFKHYPFPDKYKQAWLLRRVAELEGTTAGKTVKAKELEILNLNQTITSLQNKVKELENKGKEKDNKIADLEKSKKELMKFWIERIEKQTKAIRTFYDNAIKLVPNNNLIFKNNELTNENNKLVANKKIWEQDKADLDYYKKQNKELEAEVDQYNLEIMRLNQELNKKK